MREDNGLTGFFFSVDDFEYLLAFGLPEIIRRKKETHQNKIDVLDVGCSTGEATYSLTTVILEALHLLGESEKKWEVDVLGIDKDSIRTSDSFRGYYKRSPRIGALLEGPLSKIRVEDYFEERYDHWAEFKMGPACIVKQSLIERTHFRCEDIEVYTPDRDFDIIRCMAVLRYCNNPSKVLEKLYGNLNDGGLLIESDFSNLITERYKPVYRYVYKKL